jgi:hypothetical protein
MWNTYNVPENHDPQHILDWCAQVASEVSGGLKALVLNCHGFYGDHWWKGGTGGFGWIWAPGSAVQIPENLPS